MKKPLRILAIGVLSISISLFVLSIVLRFGGFYINTTPSLPVGLYRIVDEPVSKVHTLRSVRHKVMYLIGP